RAILLECLSREDSVLRIVMGCISVPSVTKKKKYLIPSAIFVLQSRRILSNRPFIHGKVISVHSSRDISFPGLTSLHPKTGPITMLSDSGDNNTCEHDYRTT